MNWPLFQIFIGNFKEMFHRSNSQWVWLILTNIAAVNCITDDLWKLHIEHVHSQSSEPVRSQFWGSNQPNQSQVLKSKFIFLFWCQITCRCCVSWGNHRQPDYLPPNCGAAALMCRPRQSLANKRLNYFYAVQMCEMKSKWHYQANCLHQAEKNVNRQAPTNEKLNSYSQGVLFT